ncbi:t-SNARE [Lentinula lateritia]|uniref:t-SNARE n=1 Tax=Lentinula lateritia TaxID=40482 RepID=A0ABQ8V3N2_9AGAR|nr:t-SNARE [Lentinula lateritia]
MPVQDRTNEFLACVDSIISRTSIPSRRDTKQKLLQNGKSVTKSEFSRMASGIGKDISSTNIKLGKLSQLAKRKTLFDDRPVEISELTFIIKQDLASLNKQIATLQAYVKQKKAQGAKLEDGNQINEHHKNVVTLLQSKLADTSVAFQEVLEVRTQNMKESKDRTEQFMYTASIAASQPPSNSVLFNTRGDPMGDGSPSRYDSKRPQNGDMLALNLEAAEEGSGSQNGGAFMQMQMIEQQDSYIQSRSTAIESIESTIAELGQIFMQLANMVAEQGETVQRIDADSHDIAANVSGAQRELLKYYASISSNRWLMLKIFGVLIVCFLVFILVS